MSDDDELKMTPARRAALAAVGKGEVVALWPTGPKPMRWVNATRIPDALLSAPYEYLNDRGLIQVLPGQFRRSEVVLTKSGRALLEAGR
jgi:hypothetical protein